MATLVIYHGDCVDGFTSAWCMRKALEDVGNDGSVTVDYQPARYGEGPPSVADYARVYIVDFSYPRDVLWRMSEQCGQLMVIDHHKTARADLKGLDFCVFDMGRSGAGLVWDLMHPGNPRPWIVDYVEDRDLWRFELPMSREVNAALRSTEQTFEAWDELAAMPVESARELGRGAQAHIDAYVRAALKHSYMATMGGESMPMVNVTYESCSEVADALLAKWQTRAAGYYFERGDGQIQYGFRSRSDFDVSEIAKLFGGGGHAQAAGCVTDRLVHERWPA